MTPIEQLAELAADLDTVGRPDHSARLEGIIVELRAQPQQFEQAAAAFGEVCATLSALRPGWLQPAGLMTASDQATAAIRSMAAQCSAQPAPDYARPMGVPAIRHEQIAALIWTQGYLSGTGYDRVVEALAQLETWLRTNAPQE